MDTGAQYAFAQFLYHRYDREQIYKFINDRCDPDCVCGMRVFRSAAAETVELVAAANGYGVGICPSDHGIMSFGEKSQRL